MKRNLLFSFLLAMGWQVGINAQAPSIQEGTILHCFDWKYIDIMAELDNIKAAGFTAIQTSPAQTNYEGLTSWNTLYRPRNTEIGPNALGTKEQLKDLCKAAHGKGLKIIVDIVANHTDGSLQWVENYWKNGDLYHNYGSVNNWNDRYQVTHGEIGMKDLKTEDERVYSKFRTYIQDLKAIGVDGCRWDAAKHIGLPSEGDQFWAQALDKSMYNYGEILDNTGGDDNRLIPEYMLYMSVTDSPYGTNNVLGSAKNGQASPYGNGNYAPRFNTNKIVYWGESHDTYCNDGGMSDGVSQEIVDRAYAVAASHNQIPALYFSRPAGRGSQAQAGIKGSTHFKVKSVTWVNKFHNAMNGKPEYYTANGSVASITRKEGGAIIVNFRGQGNVNIANGGAYAKPGTYKDKISGNTWTITTTTISGQTDATGIAVLYHSTDNEDNFPDNPNANNNQKQLPDCVKPEPEGTIYAYFAAPTTWSNNIHVWAWKDKVNWYTAWPGNQTDVKLVGTNEEGLSVYEWVYTGTKGEPVGIIFNDGRNQTADFTFENGGYYTIDGFVATDIHNININTQETIRWYNLKGQRIEQPKESGIYIRNGKKWAVQ